MAHDCHHGALKWSIEETRCCSIYPRVGRDRASPQLPPPSRSRPIDHIRRLLAAHEVLWGGARRTRSGSGSNGPNGRPMIAPPLSPGVNETGSVWVNTTAINPPPHPLTVHAALVEELERANIQVRPFVPAQITSASSGSRIRLYFVSMSD